MREQIGRSGRVPIGGEQKIGEERDEDKERQPELGRAPKAKSRVTTNQLEKEQHVLFLLPDHAERR